MKRLYDIIIIYTAFHLARQSASYPPSCFLTTQQARNSEGILFRFQGRRGVCLTRRRLHTSSLDFILGRSFVSPLAGGQFKLGMTSLCGALSKHPFQRKAAAVLVSPINRTPITTSLIQLGRSFTLYSCRISHCRGRRVYKRLLLICGSSRPFIRLPVKAYTGYYVCSKLAIFCVSLAYKYYSTINRHMNR